MDSEYSSNVEGEGLYQELQLLCSDTTKHGMKAVERVFLKALYNSVC